MRQFVRPLLEVTAFHGLLGWLYVAACAASRPDTLSEAIAAEVPMRRDTFGACCFAVSAAAAFALQIRGETLSPRAVRQCRPTAGAEESAGLPGNPAVDAALRTTAVYALLLWGYLCVNSLTHPATTARQLTHFAPVPSEGTTAVLSFAVSAAALLALRARGGRAVRPAGRG